MSGIRLFSFLFLFLLIEWYNRCLDVLNNIETLYQGKDSADIIQSKILQLDIFVCHLSRETNLLNGKNEDMKLLWGRNLKTGDFSGLHAECLTDTWVGKDRWAFFDLSAGPFSWGPAVGGEGVRRELSLPNVEKAIGAVAGIEKSHERYIFCCMQSAAYWLGVGERTMQI